jgi:hypothetical protein
MRTARGNENTILPAMDLMLLLILVSFLRVFLIYDLLKSSRFHSVAERVATSTGVSYEITLNDMPEESSHS